MKQTPDDIELAANLAKGFLGDDTRAAWEIVAADNIPGIDREQIASRLAEILAEAMAHYGNPVEIELNDEAVDIGPIPVNCRIGKEFGLFHRYIDELDNRRDIFSFRPLYIVIQKIAAGDPK